MAALADFNAVDHHLLEARQVFRDLRNIKDIEAWSFGRPDLDRWTTGVFGPMEHVAPVAHRLPCPP